MKLPTLLSILTIIALLVTGPRLLGQCHGGGGSHSDHKDSSSKSVKQSDEVTNTDEVIFYACSMHPEIKSLTAGTCSKCGMNLDQKKANLVKALAQKDSVYYTCPMHPEVKENKLVNCSKCGMELIKKSSKELATTETKNKFSFKVSGNCGMCKTHIEKSAKSVSGVISAEWDSETKIIAVVSENKSLDAKEVSDAITAGGYDTEYKTAQDEAYNKLPGCCKYEREKK